MFVPPPTVPSSALPNVYSGYTWNALIKINNCFPFRTDTNIYNPSYQPPGLSFERKKIYRFHNFTGEPNPTPWTNYPTTTGYDQQQQQDPSSANPSGIWGWISGNKMLATVVEKAKVI